MQVTLRLLDLDALVENTGLFDLTAVYQGTVTGAKRWAAANGYKWKTDRQALFGGYFAKPNGDCLLIT